MLDLNEISGTSKYIIRSVNALGNVIETFYSNFNLSKYQTIEINPTKEAPTLRIIRQTAGEANLYVMIDAAYPLSNIYDKTEDISNNVNNLSNNIDDLSEDLKSVDDYDVDLFSVSQKKLLL